MEWAPEWNITHIKLFVKCYLEGVRHKLKQQYTDFKTGVHEIDTIVSLN